MRNFLTGEHSVRIRILLACFLSLIAFPILLRAQEPPGALPAAPAPVPAAPKKFTPADSSADPDNRHVRVLRFKIPVDGSLDLPKLANEGLLLCLKCDLLRRIPEGGDGEPWEGGPGSALWNRGGVGYNMENRGPAPAELLLIELKDSYAITQVRVPYSERDPMLVDPSHFRVRLENDQVRVLQLSLKPRDGTDESQFAARLEIALDDLRANELFPGGKLVESSQSSGGAKWNEAQLKSIINAGEKPLDELIVEFKHPFCYQAETLNSEQDKNPELKKYFSELQGKVAKLWYKKMPPEVRGGETGFLALRLTIQQDGTLLEDGIEFQEVFASDSLVGKAVNAVRSAAPFPPLPKAIPNKETTIRSVFLYNLSSRPGAGCHD